MSSSAQVTPASPPGTLPRIQEDDSEKFPSLFYYTYSFKPDASFPHLVEVDNRPVQAEAPDYDLITRGMQEALKRKKEQKAAASTSQTYSRKAMAGSIPRATTGLAKSLNAWVRSVLGMHATDSPLPDPPSPAELTHHLHSPPSHQAAQIQNLVNQALVGACSDPRKKIGPAERAFIWKNILKDITLQHFNAPTPSQEPPSIQIQPFGSDMVEMGLALVQKAGFTRCTFQWDQPVTSHWNKSMVAILWESWKICHSLGGHSNYTINEEENTPSNCLKIINRWVAGRREKWQKQQNMDRAASSSYKKKGSSAQKAKLKVIFCFCYHLLIFIPENCSLPDKPYLL